LVKKGAGNRLRVASLLIFSISLILLLLASGIYHAFEPGLGKQIFRRLDYACIYLLIAGTGTPIHVILFRGWWRWGMLVFIWSFAVIGLILMAIATAFSFITLPVEYDASNRALAWLKNKNMVSQQEFAGAEDALKWAARTYVVAAIGALASLIYWAMQVFGSRD
jgi:Zn-dependent membrane protease YugP